MFKYFQRGHGALAFALRGSKFALTLIIMGTASWPTNSCTFFRLHPIFAVEKPVPRHWRANFRLFGNLQIADRTHNLEFRMQNSYPRISPESPHGAQK